MLMGPFMRRNIKNEKVELDKELVQRRLAEQTRINDWEHQFLEKQRLDQQEREEEIENYRRIEKSRRDRFEQEILDMEEEITEHRRKEKIRKEQAEQEVREMEETIEENRRKEGIRREQVERELREINEENRRKEETRREKMEQEFREMETKMEARRAAEKARVFEWEQAFKQRKDRELDQWQNEVDHRRDDERRRKSKWESDIRQEQQQEREREEWWHHEEEQRQRLGLYWDAPTADPHCAAYGMREYWARLLNTVPYQYNWLKSCEEIPIQIHGRSMNTSRCFIDTDVSQISLLLVIIIKTDGPWK